MIECPDFVKCISNWVRTPQNTTLGIRGIFGIPDETPESLHRWCYQVPELMTKLQSVGFRQIYEEPAQWHAGPIRDMRIVAKKLDIAKTPAIMGNVDKESSFLAL